MSGAHDMALAYARKRTASLFTDGEGNERPHRTFTAADQLDLFPGADCDSCGL